MAFPYSNNQTQPGGAIPVWVAETVPSAPLTYDPATSTATLSNGNLTASSAAFGHALAVTAAAKTAGKVYFETTIVVPGAGFNEIGFATSSANLSSGGGNDASSVAFLVYPSGTINYNSGQAINVNYTAVAGDVIGIAIDVTNKLAWFSNAAGAWLNLGLGVPNPVKGTGGLSISFINITAQGGLLPFSLPYNGTDTVNFGATPFAHSLPSGFSSYDGSQIPGGAAYPNNQTLPTGAIPVYLAGTPGTKLGTYQSVPANAIPIRVVAKPSGPRFPNDQSQNGGAIPVYFVPNPATKPFSNEQPLARGAIPVWEP